MKIFLTERSPKILDDSSTHESWPAEVTPDWVVAMVDYYTPFVQRVAREIYRRLPSGATTAPDDLVSDGLIGLLHAIQNFKPGRGAKFSTYAYYRIKGSMLDSLRQAPLLSFPRSYFAKNRAQQNCPIENDVTESEGIIPLTVLGIHEVESDVVDSELSPLQALIKAETTESIRSALERLSKIERAIIQLRYIEDLTLRQIARELGISRQTVLNISIRVERRLRSILSRVDVLES